MMRFAPLAVAAMLAGCAALAPAPGPDLAVRQVVTVERPIPTPCVKASGIPPIPAPPKIAADADPEQRAAWVGVRNEQLEQHIGSLRATLFKCSATNQ